MSVLKKLFFSGGAAMFWSFAAMATPYVNVTVLGSTDPSASRTYAAGPITATAGQTIYYQVVSNFVPPAAGLSNTNTSKTPNGTQDTLGSLPMIRLTGAPFSASNIAFDTGVTGADHGAGVNGASTLDIRASWGTAVNGDNQTTAVPILTGSFAAGAAGNVITGAYNGANAEPVTVGIANASLSAPNGSIRVANTPTSITNTSESTSGDPYIQYNGLTVAVPEPASMSALGLVGTLLFRRGRRSRKS